MSSTVFVARVVSLKNGTPEPLTLKGSFKGIFTGSFEGILQWGPLKVSFRVPFGDSFKGAATLDSFERGLRFGFEVWV